MLSFWDAEALDAAGQDGEVAPSFVNLADASIKMVSRVQMLLTQALTVVDRDFTYTQSRRPASPKRSFHLYRRSKPISVALQLITLLDTVDCRDSVGYVRECLLARVVHRLADRGQGTPS